MNSIQEIQSAQLDVEIFLENIKQTAEIQEAKAKAETQVCFAWYDYQRLEVAYRYFRMLWEAWGQAPECANCRKAVDYFNDTLFKAENYLFQLRLKTQYRIG